MLANLISLAANTRKPLLQVVEEHGLRLLDQAVMVEEVAVRFAERKRHMNVCDFDDLLIHWLRLLEDPRLSEVAALVRSAYDHVLVDEYQDVSAIQGALVDAMAKEHGSLVCVGDDAQSIYGFRGADFAQIAEFRGRHPNARLYPLTINYRSTPEVLALANRSIARNVKQYPKELVAVKKSGPKPAVIRCATCSSRPSSSPSACSSCTTSTTSRCRAWPCSTATTRTASSCRSS
ncbi:UvrD-helicase domain-containing protein [Nannocystis pusilla]|uniref:UvrD-helicase domain-containing protein n=1 Tax=Nannocystis pusilla TaxID=889268 RepID=UPI003B7B63A7